MSETRTSFLGEVGGAVGALSLEVRPEASADVSWVEGVALLWTGAMTLTLIARG